MPAFSRLSIAQIPRRVRPIRDEPVPVLPASYWLLLLFLLLLYANTPFVLPAAEVIHPAKLVAGATLLAVLIETLSGRRDFSFPWPEGGWLIAFVAAAAVSCITALWPGYAVEAVLDLAKMALVYFLLATGASSARALQGVMWVMIVGGMFPALGTLKNYLQGNLYEGRAAWVGIFANPNEVAYSLVILLPLAAYLASTRGWMVRLPLLGISICFVAAIYVTFSRGGLIGLVAVAGLYAWRKRSLWLSVSLVILVAAGLVLAGRNWSRGEDFSQLDNDVSLQQRMATFDAGFNMFLDHPLLGVGPRCSVVAWPLYAPPGIRARGALITHNTFVQIFSETGILGAIPFLMFIATGLWYARKLVLERRTKDLGIGVEVAIWGFVVCGMSGGYVITWFPYVLLGLAAAARRVAKESPVEDPVAHQRTARPRPFGLVRDTPV